MILSRLPLDGVSAVVIRRTTLWPHDVILLAPATTTSGVLASALYQPAIEHHRNGDVPDHDYVLKVTETSMPDRRRGGFEETLTALDIAALKASGPKHVMGVGDVPAIVVHMAPTPR
jgi:hypothetical protein